MLFCLSVCCVVQQHKLKGKLENWWLALGRVNGFISSISNNSFSLVSLKEGKKKRELFVSVMKWCIFAVVSQHGYWVQPVCVCSFKGWSFTMLCTPLFSELFCCNVDLHSNESSLRFHRSVAHISLRPLAIKDRAIELIWQVDIEDEPFCEYVLGKRTHWDLETQDRRSRALTVWRNDSYHFAFKGVKCVFWLPPP